MRNLLTFCVVLAALCISCDVRAQTAQELLDNSRRAANKGLDEIDNILLVTETMGWSTLEYFEKTSSIEHNGETLYVMRNVPITELQERQSADNPMANATPGDLQRAAAVVEEQGIRMENEMLGAMNNSDVGGLAGGAMKNLLMNPPKDKPWLSANPRDMTHMYAVMLNAAATEKNARLAENPEAEMRQQLADQERALTSARVVDSDPIDGRPTVALLADDLNLRPESGEDFTIDKATVFFDARTYMPLRFRMEGVMRADGETRSVFIQRDDEDYRSVPGCGDMSKPFRSVMSMGGVLNAREKAELAEAQVQMAKFEKEMASMPPSQRAMVERMMGPQMEMMKKMAETGAVEIESKVVEMRCNGGLPAATEIVMTTFGGGVRLQ
ncbi:MAG: hypothetical protein OEM25_06100 [Gammaproteobacteria bacterium]|nr:hypothetical protein [Gammaproteobacteria bacterium]